MPRPIKSTSSSVLRFKTRVPADIRDKVKGRKIELPLGSIKQVVTIGEFVEASLQTRNPPEAKARHSAALAAVLRYWEAVRAGPQPLTHRQATALAGIVYRDLVAAIPDAEVTRLADAKQAFRVKLASAERANEFATEVMRHFLADVGMSVLVLALTKAQWTPLLPDFDWYDMLEVEFGPMVDRVLTREGIVIDEQGRRLLLDCVRDAVADAGADVYRKTDGDYSPDPKAHRFPPASDAKPKSRSKLSVTDLFAGYIKELQAGGQGSATEKRWKPIINLFVAFLKHDDAARVTKGDIIAWKDHRLLTQGLSAKTVRDSDLAALKAIFRWAVDNLKLPLNPADGVKIKMPNKVQTRAKGFTDSEALAILKAAHAYEKPEKEYDETAAAKRWAPWLCAFTGARIAEICQLRKEDIFEQDGIPVMRITPEAGSVKSGRFRHVPLHPQLVELGLLRFVGAAKDGPLFHQTRRRKGSTTWPQGAVAGTVGEWVNSLGVIEGKVAPNHAWRHRFKSLARDVGMQARVADAIQDHAARTSGEAYGDVSLKAKLDAILLLPRYAI